MIAIEAISWFPTLLLAALVGLILYWGFSSRAREVRRRLVAAIQTLLSVGSALMPRG